MQRPKGRRSLVAGALLAGGMLFGLSTAATAQEPTPTPIPTPTPQHGPTPPQFGDPVGDDISPHGGYSSATSFCLQCHSIHTDVVAGQIKEPAEYAFLRESSVTNTCKTCHGIGGAAPGGAYDPDLGPGAIGTASVRSVYDVADPAGQHGVGATAIPDEPDASIMQSNWAYSWRSAGGPPGSSSPNEAGPGTASEGSGGLYCASCHTPHAEFGQVVNWGWKAADDGMEIWTPPSTTSTSGQARTLRWSESASKWQSCALNAPADDASCVAYDELQVMDQQGQKVSLAGYKLLSRFPNHQYAERQTYKTTYRNRDTASWCGSCHTTKEPSEFGGDYHNHPTGCVSCHGNPKNDPYSTDFPHQSSIGKLLTDYPDALCAGCHTEGSLP